MVWFWFGLVWFGGLNGLVCSGGLTGFGLFCFVLVWFGLVLMVWLGSVVLMVWFGGFNGLVCWF